MQRKFCNSLKLLTAFAGMSSGMKPKELGNQDEFKHSPSLWHSFAGIASCLSTMPLSRGSHMDEWGWAAACRLVPSEKLSLNETIPIPCHCTCLGRQSKRDYLSIMVRVIARGVCSTCMRRWVVAFHYYPEKPWTSQD